MRLRFLPVTIREALEYVDTHHRHHGAPVGAIFAVAVALGESSIPCGVALVGRPVARALDNGWTAEITRCCTDGTRNACSKLYGKATREARRRGFYRVITYTISSERGTSLLAAGFHPAKKTRGGSWNCRSRPRRDRHPLERKIRWERRFFPHA